MGLKRKRVPSDHSSERPLPASALALRTSIPGFSPGRRSSFLVSSSPLPATLAGRLPTASHRGFRIRVVTRGISSGSVAAFRHRRPSARSSPARTSQPAFRPTARCPEGLSVLPRNALRRHPGVEVSLAFFLNPAPRGFRFGVRAFPAVPIPVLANKNQPALLTRLLRPTHRYAERFATSSPTSPRASFAFPPCGLPAALARPCGISPKLLPAHC